jgi:hypothetical protein
MSLEHTCIEMDIQPYKLIESLILKHVPECVVTTPKGTLTY